MDIKDAFAIVLDLARENILDEHAADKDEVLFEERANQIVACNMVEDFIVNQLGDD